MSRRLRQIPLDLLERETGLSRHTGVRARRGQPLQRTSLQLRKLAQRALRIFEKVLGERHPNTIVCRSNYHSIEEKVRAVEHLG